MDISVVEAYAKGKIAGVNHFFALQRDPGTKQPTSPYPSAQYLATVEWERGFGDGLAQGQRGGSRARASVNDRRQAV
jgi:hypothetical protein